MIDDYAISEKLIANAEEAIELIHQSLFLVMDNRPQEEFFNYRLAVAETLSAIHDNIVAPLSKAHPDLDPLKIAPEPALESREDDVPVYDEEAPPMLERLYHVRNEDGSTIGLNVHLSKPAKSQDGNDWYCTYQVASQLGFQRKKAFGVDGMQSYQAAIACIAAYIKSIVDPRKITWAGGEGLQLV